MKAWIITKLIEWGLPWLFEIIGEWLKKLLSPESAKVVEKVQRREGVQTDEMEYFLREIAPR